MNSKLKYKYKFKSQQYQEVNQLILLIIQFFWKHLAQRVTQFKLQVKYRRFKIISTQRKRKAILEKNFINKYMNKIVLEDLNLFLSSTWSRASRKLISNSFNKLVKEFNKKRENRLYLNSSNNLNLNSSIARLIKWRSYSNKRKEYVGI